MTDDQNLGLRKINRALISVSDKTGIVDFARQLKDLSVEIISTGGTAKALREAGIEVRDVSEVTGFPEMMDGRVKTLHPKIHGGLLGIRDNLEHQTAMQEHGIQPIDLVVVNLYPFEETIKREGVTEEEAIEQIDIGGPAMIRSAAKNYHDVAVVVLPKDYPTVVQQLTQQQGSLDVALRSQLAREAFAQTSRYDSIVFTYLMKGLLVEQIKSKGLEGGIGTGGGAYQVTSQGIQATAHSPRIDSEEFSIEAFHGSLPGSAQWSISKTANLRYGENPHQIAGLYQTGMRSGIANAQLLSGKEMSYNNYVDADAAWQLVGDFDEPACAIIKHTNPAGVALGSNTEEAYRRALATDPTSAFGGVVASNLEVDESAARAIIEIFTEVLIAPDYEPAALEILKTKKNLRVLKAADRIRRESVEYKQISGGMLVQTRDSHILKREDLKVVTNREPTDDEIRDLMFAWIVCKHTKSNAIVYAREEQTVGVGAGQMSRVDSVKLGAMRAQLPVAGSVLASDAFFPFRDGIDEAGNHGITAVIQPGGSMRDAEVITAANEHGLAMVFTGIRHFKH
ncbi:MAG TPA: bifunctional phosphoribosylaminoimidazolecarboxamide formyltransferase/IMP cyclohydrolase [Pyrinomonadaceae bacterium]|nr:bifunctional phosphoribosylaminoimidazolecarboxamide formyltransferase/IMP cyclohydrolase [Pyrinomonadaceae bacterium]